MRQDEDPAIAEHRAEEVVVLIDTMVSVENITRMAENMGMVVSEPAEQHNEYRIVIRPAER